jgi:uncharacterized protein with GYD domain
MPMYIGLLKWTDQGIRNVKETVTRVGQARGAIENFGGRLVGVWWTQGAYDLVIVAELPDDETVSALTLSIGMTGSVRSETLRAYNAEEMQRIVQRLP